MNDSIKEALSNVAMQIAALYPKLLLNSLAGLKTHKALDRESSTVFLRNLRHILTNGLLAIECFYLIDIL